MPDHILVAVDSSACAEAAVDFAAAEWPDADLTFLHVVDPADAAASAEAGFPAGAEEWYEGARSRAAGVLEDAAARVDREVETRIEVGAPVGTVCEVAGEGPYDHVVVGSHGRTGIERVLVGSVAEGVVRRADPPVTVVR